MFLSSVVPPVVPQTTWEWVVAIMMIVMIDIVLAGDNAVVIAMAVRSLPDKERKIGIALGAGVAVVLRIGLTFVASQLLNISYIKLIGGLLILWIAVKLLKGSEEGEGDGKNAAGVWQAVWLILVADVTMSLDNVLAVAGASKGSFTLLVFGLALSIPLVVFTSNLLAKLMNKYPVIVYIGAAILGKVGGQMIMEDPFIVGLLGWPHWVSYVVEFLCAFGVIGVAKLIYWKKSAVAE